MTILLTLLTLITLITLLMTLMTLLMTTDSIGDFYDNNVDSNNSTSCYDDSTRD